MPLRKGHHITSYQPKGGMCASCANVQRNCSCLPFDQMPVIEIDGTTAIVRCINHQPLRSVSECLRPNKRIRTEH